MIGEAIAGVVGKIIDRVWQDPAEKAQAAIELQKMVQAGEFKQIDAELQAMQMQADVNKVEAASSSVFVAGWRPWSGWVCGCALAYSAILCPVMQFFARIYGYTGTFPEIDNILMSQVLLGLLGLGQMRSNDKKNGVAS